MKRKKRLRQPGDNVIFVDFAARGRAASLTPEAPRTIDARLRSEEPAVEVFTAAEVSRLSGLSLSRLRQLDRAGVVSPTSRASRRRAYTFRDLIALRMVQCLLTREVRMRDLAAAVKALRGRLPKASRSLAELRIVSDGRRVVVRSAEGAFEPLTGQMLLDFEVRQLRDDVVRVLRPRSESDRTRVAYDFYRRACALDESNESLDEAALLYRQALELDPTLSIAYTNLGNIEFRRNNEEAAIELYHRALDLDPAQPEAQYNLGYILLERGQPSSAIPFFEAAVQGNHSFADAHFYLAMAYESLGDAQSARPSWNTYLELDPEGTWADIARRHL